MAHTPPKPNGLVDELAPAVAIGAPRYLLQVVTASARPSSDAALALVLIDGGVADTWRASGPARRRGSAAGEPVRVLRAAGWRGRARAGTAGATNHAACRTLC
jgi:hypothetical protein